MKSKKAEIQVVKRLIKEGIEINKSESTDIMNFFEMEGIPYRFIGKEWSITSNGNSNYPEIFLIKEIDNSRYLLKLSKFENPEFIVP